MAYADLVPQSFFQSITQGTKQFFSVDMFDSAGAPVDTSAWDAFKFKLVPAGGLGLATAPLNLTTQVAPTSTACKFDITAAQSTALFPGNYQLFVEGRPTSGDDYQLMVSGTLSVNLSA